MYQTSDFGRIWSKYPIFIFSPYSLVSNEGCQYSTQPMNMTRTWHEFLRIRVGPQQIRVINGLTRKRHNKKQVIGGSICVTCNRHIWHVNLFVLTRNDSFNPTRLTHITNKYLFYFKFIKYLLYLTYILNFKKKKKVK